MPEEDVDNEISAMADTVVLPQKDVLRLMACSRDNIG